MSDSVSDESGAAQLAHLAPFARRLKSASLQAIASDLLRSFSDRSGTIQFAPEPSPERQLFHLFNTLDPTPGERLKFATARAIAEWSPIVHGYGTLRGLACLAGYIRALKAANIISRVLLEQLPGGVADPPRIRASQDLLRVLLGLPPDEEFRSAFVDLLFADFSPPSFWGLAFVGACKHDTANFDKYAMRYLDLLKISREREIVPSPEAPIHRLIAEVTFRRVAEALPKLSGRYLKWMMRLLCTEAWSPARFEKEQGTDTAYLIDCRPYVSSCGSRYMLSIPAEKFVDLMVENTNVGGAVADANRAVKDRRLLTRSASS